MSDLTAVLVAVLLLAANAFFVGAEFALVSARRTQIEPRVEAGSRAARTTRSPGSETAMNVTGYGCGGGGSSHARSPVSERTIAIARALMGYLRRHTAVRPASGLRCSSSP